MMKSVLKGLFLSVLIERVAGQCLPSIASVNLRELNANTSEKRSYIMCPDTVYSIGSYNQMDVGDFDGGDAFFKPQSNMEVSCGPDGSSDGNCTIMGGNLHIALSTVMNITDPAYNVVFRGFTFAESTRYSFWGNLPGSITFYDCIFRDHTDAYAMILLDYFDNDADEELSVSFIKCQFLNNTYYGTPSYGALITGNGIQNRLSLQNSRFENNDMLFNNTVPLRTSFLVETSGPINADLNCFTNNQVGVAPIGVYVAPVSAEGNYGVESAGSICPMIASFETSTQFELYVPTCGDFDSTTCLEQQTISPTAAPSGAPSSSPSSPPSVAPSATPTAAPTLGPTAAPTISPAPTITSQPTGVPSMQPTEFSAGSVVGPAFSAFAAGVVALWVL